MMEKVQRRQKRMMEFFDRILKEYGGKKIAVISHRWLNKIFLIKLVKVNEDVRLVYNNTVLDITSPCLLKVIFRKNELVNLEQIK